MLGPPCNLLKDPLPQWQFELSRDNWKDYSLEDSMQVDRYWKVFGSNPDLCLAKVVLMKKEAILDFQDMTCRVGESHPRKVRRTIQDPGWLTNRFFWDAFKDALSKAGITVDKAAQEVFDFRFNQDFRNE